MWGWPVTSTLVAVVDVLFHDQEVVAGVGVVPEPDGIVVLTDREMEHGTVAVVAAPEHAILS